MSSFNYIQMPPDGTGKKSKQTVITSINFNSGVNEFSLGDIVTTDEGFLGTVVSVSGATISGNIHCMVDHDSAYAVVPDNAPLKVDNVIYAVSNGESEVRFNQDVVITGGNNVLNKAHVTDQGSMQTAFASGDPLFDAFGKLGVSETTTIREYQPVHDTLPDLFTEITENGATISWDNTRHVVVMENPITNGARSLRRTDLYHKYQTGVSTTCLFSMFTGGDYMNVERRAGMFDDRDGLYFMMKDGVISVNIRSSCNGVVEETSVSQDEWNIDRLDGSSDVFNVSGKVLSTGVAQVLFIDYQWLGAGRVRFGFVIDGIYIVCHEFNNAGTIANPYMRTGSLPFSMEQINTSTLANPAFFYNISAAVKCEGKFTPRETLHGGSLPGFIALNDDTNYIPLASFRCKQFIDGEENRSVILPTNITVSELTNTDKPWLLEIVKNDDIVGGSWVDNSPHCALEINGGSTGSTNGRIVMSWTVTGDEHIDLTPFFSFYNELVIRDADINSEPDHFTLRARNYDTTPINIVLAFNWKEIR